MDDRSLYNSLLLTLYLITPLTLIPLQFLSAPYGKHSRPGWGPTLPAPLAWFLMESPTLWLTALLFPLGQFRSHPLPILAFSLYLLHYTHRTILYPLRLSLANRPTSPIPITIVLFAFAFNLLNGYVQARSLSHYHPISPNSLVYARIIIGTAIFFWGMKVNIESDRALMRLKEEGKGAYRIPRGGWFEVVSCPNYMGELAEWFGWAVLNWSPAALAFALYTFANLGPRARAHRRWYREKFGEEYPASRKAIVPLVY